MRLKSTKCCFSKNLNFIIQIRLVVVFLFDYINCLFYSIFLYINYTFYKQSCSGNYYMLNSRQIFTRIVLKTVFYDFSDRKNKKKSNSWIDE